MSEFETWRVAPAIGAGLTRMGWQADDHAVRDVLPAVTRGSSVVAVLPPSPAWAGPVAAGVLAGLADRGGRALVLAAPAQVAEWGTLLATVADGTALRVEAATGPARAARRLKADAVDCLIVSPDTAVALQSRSALAADRITTVVLAWPEGWDGDEALTVLLQDLPKDAQRVVLTARADRLDGGDGLIERYARKAVVVGAPSADSDRTPAGPVRTAPTPWATRAATIAALVEATDPHLLTVWTADTRDHATLRAALGGLGDGLALANRTVPSGGTIVCHDVPSLEQLRELIAAGDVVLLVPPGTETHVAQIAAPRRPVVLESATTALLRRDAGLRQTVTGALAQGPDAAALYALAPLFERHEPQAVAAALWTLWQGATARGEASATPAAPAVRSATPVGGVQNTRVWIGAGKKDEATVGDFVAVLAKEVGLDRSLIGRIELRDTFALVEVPAAEAERVAQRLTGLTIRRRRITARVDRGPTERPERSDRSGPPKRRF